MAVPILSGEKILGVFYLDSQKTTYEFDHEELELFSAFATLIGSAVELVQVIESRRELFTDSVQALVRAVEAKDPYTAGHSSRVGLYSRAIAVVLELSELEREEMLIAGYLHDIGKIGISDSYIRKEGPLKESEIQDFRRHPVIGVNILTGSDDLKNILPAIRWHHERLDGQGYPEGLTEAEIPLSAKIIAVADAFDAMTTTRSYRPSRGIDFALSELKRTSGTHFDQQVVTAFIAALTEKIVPFMGQR